jgi:hypothetical protein
MFDNLALKVLLLVGVIGLFGWVLEQFAKDVAKWGKRR